MWISRKELAALENRVKKLEDKERYYCGNEFTVYDQQYIGSGIPYYHIPNQKITLKEAVQKILDHLGLKMEYIKGPPTRVDFVKAKKV